MKRRKAVIGLLLLIAIFPLPAAAEEYSHLNFPDENQVEYRYGGIPASADRPPIGTTINQELSNYYLIPVATRDNGGPAKYFYIGGWWFTQDEMMNLPKESLMYGQSPYAITDSG